MFVYRVTTLTNLNCLLQESAGFANTSFLFCGDWNVVQNKSDDTYNVIHNRNQNARKKIEELKETFELLDPWQTSPIKESRIKITFLS